MEAACFARAALHPFAGLSAGAARLRAGVSFARCVALLALLGSCTSKRAVCELGAPELVARSDGLEFDGVAVAEAGLFAWSSADGLFVARHERRQRVGERCRGGVALAASAEAVYLACSRPSEQVGEVVLQVLDQALHAQAVHVLGPAGRDGRGVALALRDGQPLVAFHDGSIGTHAISLASVHLQASAPPSTSDTQTPDAARAVPPAQSASSVRRVSRSGHAAAQPALLVHEGHAYLAFVELNWSDASDASAASAATRGAPTRTSDASAETSATTNAEIWIARDDEPARMVLRTAVDAPAPTLAADASGLVLGYRDRTRGARSELHVVRLDSALRPHGPTRVIGRANSEGAPSVYGCAGFTAALLPREYGSERFLAVNQLDQELAAVGAGHQFYTSGHDFVLASGACTRDALLVLAAERATPAKPGVEAMLLRFRCTP